MNGRAPAILDHLSALADPTRSRLLLLLDRHELTVSELCGILQLPQSTVSRHLKALADSGWIAARAEGTSHLYTLQRDDLDAAARRLWQLVREQVGSTPAAAQDQRRLQSALAERRTKSQEFFSSSAGQWDRLREELFGDRFHLAALAGLADPSWVVGDLGCGAGQVDRRARALRRARHRRRRVGRDAAGRAQAAAGRMRTSTCAAASSRRCRSTTRGSTLAAVMLVLHHVAEPEKALAEAARVLKPGGRLLLVDMLPHDRKSYRQQMGHVWLGFSDEQIHRLLERERIR